jgi:hypothetical protein
VTAEDDAAQLLQHLHRFHNRPTGDEHDDSDEQVSVEELRKLRAVAQGRAKTRLVGEFGERYSRLYEEELEKLRVGVARPWRVAVPITSPTDSTPRCDRPAGHAPHIWGDLRTVVYGCSGHGGPAYVAPAGQIPHWLGDHWTTQPHNDDDDQGGDDD